MKTKSIGHRWVEWPYFSPDLVLQHKPGTLNALGEPIGFAQVWYCVVCYKRRYWWRLFGTCHRDWGDGNE